MNDFFAQLPWYALVILFIVSGTVYDKNKKLKKELERKEESLNIIYDEIYAADRLTGFVKRLEAISEQYETPNLKLPDMHSDLKNYIESTERSMKSPIGYDLVVLKDQAARDELEQVRTKLIKRKS